MTLNEEDVEGENLRKCGTLSLCEIPNYNLGAAVAAQ